jgi:hypothetical protein
MNGNKTKFLISTAAHFTGEFEYKHLKIKHAWHLENSYTHSRIERDEQNFLVIEYELEDNAHLTQLIEELNLTNSIGSIICNILSGFYGKVFYYHGAFEDGNLYLVPDIQYVSQKYKNATPYNSTLRSETNIELKFSELDKIKSILNLEIGNNSKKKMKTMIAALKQYNLSLQYVNTDPDMAYISMVESGEILSNIITICTDDLLTKDEKEILEEIKDLKDGEKKYKYIKSKFRQISKRFVAGLMSTIDENFYNSKKGIHEKYLFQKDNIEIFLKGSYNLRSLYVHEGGSFGRNTMPTFPFLSDYISSHSTGHSPKMKKALDKAASFTGLEKIIQYSIFKNLVNLENSLGY